MLAIENLIGNSSPAVVNRAADFRILAYLPMAVALRSGEVVKQTAHFVVTAQHLAIRRASNHALRKKMVDNVLAAADSCTVARQFAALRRNFKRHSPEPA
jgi:hypothetical protein